MGALRGVCYVNVSSRCGVTVERRADRYGASVGHVNLLLATASLLPGAGTRAGVVLYVRGLAQFVPIARFSAKEHRARVDGRATVRHLHGIIERTVRCYTVKVSAESAGAVASTMFLESLPTRQSGRLAQPDGGAGTPAGRGCHLQGRSAPPSWTTP